VEGIPKVFQVFSLDLIELKKMELKKKSNEAHLLRKSFPEKGQSLIKELKVKGYEVLIGTENYCGLPMSLIVVGEIPSEKVIKSDFSEIAEKLGLRWFRSGEVYFETK